MHHNRRTSTTTPRRSLVQQRRSLSTKARRHVASPSVHRLAVKSSTLTLPSSLLTTSARFIHHRKSLHAKNTILPSTSTSTEGGFLVSKATPSRGYNAHRAKNSAASSSRRINPSISNYYSSDSEDSSDYSDYESHAAGAEEFRKLIESMIRSGKAKIVQLPSDQENDLSKLVSSAAATIAASSSSSSIDENVIDASIVNDNDDVTTTETKKQSSQPKKGRKTSKKQQPAASDETPTDATIKNIDKLLEVTSEAQSLLSLSRNRMNNLSAPDIVSFLDFHVIAQSEAKKALAIAVRNRERRFRLEKLTKPTGIQNIEELGVRLAQKHGYQLHPNMLTKIGPILNPLTSTVSDTTTTTTISETVNETVPVPKKKGKKAVAAAAAAAAAVAATSNIPSPVSVSTPTASPDPFDNLRTMLSREQLSQRNDDLSRFNQTYGQSLAKEINPFNILLVGPTGSGKTELIKRLSQLLGAPYVHADATRYTETGVVGNDVDQIVTNLYKDALEREKEMEKEKVYGSAKERALSSIIFAIQRQKDWSVLFRFLEQRGLGHLVRNFTPSAPAADDDATVTPVTTTAAARNSAVTVAATAASDNATAETKGTAGKAKKAKKSKLPAAGAATAVAAAPKAKALKVKVAVPKVKKIKGQAKSDEAQTSTTETSNSQAPVLEAAAPLKTRKTKATKATSTTPKVKKAKTLAASVSDNNELATPASSIAEIATTTSTGTKKSLKARKSKTVTSKTTSKKTPSIESDIEMILADDDLRAAIEAEERNPTSIVEKKTKKHGGKKSADVSPAKAKQLASLRDNFKTASTPVLSSISKQRSITPFDESDSGLFSSDLDDASSYYRKVVKPSTESQKKRDATATTAAAAATTTTTTSTSTTGVFEGGKDDLFGNKYYIPTHAELREWVLKGYLDDFTVEVSVPVPTPPKLNNESGFQAVIPGGELLLEELDGLRKPKMTNKKLSVTAALETLIDHHQNQLVNEDELHERALQNAERNGIIFIDEIDKLISIDTSSTSKSKGEGVQREMLSLLQGKTIKKGNFSIRTDNILFICAGAFHHAAPGSLLPELQGRLPVVARLEPLTQAQLALVLTLPVYSVLKQYMSLMKGDGIDIQMSDDAVLQIAKSAAELNERSQNLGARRLHNIINSVFGYISYHYANGKELKIDDLGRVHGFSEPSHSTTTTTTPPEATLKMHTSKQATNSINTSIALPPECITHLPNGEVQITISADYVKKTLEHMMRTVDIHKYLL